MSITQTAAIAKCRLRLQDRSTRRDGTAISTPRFSDTDIATALNDAIRTRQELIQRLDPTWYLSTLDFVGITDAIGSSSSTTLPIVASEQYAAPANFRQFVRLARRDLPNLPSVRLVPHQDQDAIYQGGSDLFSGFYSSYPNTASTDETVSLVTYNAGGTLSNRLRLKPAPGATTFLYRLFFQRAATEPASGGHVLDVPPDWVEVIALDAAEELAASVNLATLPTIQQQRDAALAARLDDEGGRYAGRHVVGDVRI